MSTEANVDKNSYRVSSVDAHVKKVTSGDDDDHDCYIYLYFNLMLVYGIKESRFFFKVQ